MKINIKGVEFDIDDSKIQKFVADLVVANIKFMDDYGFNALDSGPFGECVGAFINDGIDGGTHSKLSDAVLLPEDPVDNEPLDVPAFLRKVADA